LLTLQNQSRRYSAYFISLQYTIDITTEELEYLLFSREGQDHAHAWRSTKKRGDSNIAIAPVKVSIN